MYRWSRSSWRCSRKKSTASQILKDAGVTEKELRQAIEELRKGNKVTSQSAEDTYDALGKIRHQFERACP